MANTYTQLYVQAVFAPKRKHSLIDVDWEIELYKYITGIVKKNGHRLFAINGTNDHLHSLISMTPNQSLSELMQIIKSNTSKWINESKFTLGRFEWQEGFGGFTYSKSQIPAVVKYIENQKEHHKKTSFLDEYRKFLKLYEIDYKEVYIFKEPV